MKKKGIISLMLAAVCAVSLLAGCGGRTGSGTAEEAAGSENRQETEAAVKNGGTDAEKSDHPVITMNAPYPNMSLFSDLVHEKYPEINLEIIPYNGQDTSAYMKNMRQSGQMTDLYFTTFYTPGRYADADDFLDLSAYEFTDHFTQSRLREVTYNGGIYMLPLAYSALGITYNKTLLDKNGWTLPTNLDELEALKEQAEAAGYVFSRCQLEFPGYGFQYLCNIADTGFLSTIDGLAWQEAFLKGEASVSDTPQLMETLEVLNRWREMGMLNGEGTPDDDTATKASMEEGNTLFLVGNSNDLLDKADAGDTYRLMPYLSEDGNQNIFILNVERFVGLNKALGEAGNEQKLEDAVHVMELLSTEEGIRALDPGQNNSRLLPLKEWMPDEDSYYADVLGDLNSGHIARLIYSGWETITVPVGETMIQFIKGEAGLEDVIRCMDDNQHLLSDHTGKSYTTVTETIGTEDCAKLVGMAFGEAVGAEAALVSWNVWNYNPDASYMNRFGVSGSLFPLPVTDEELVSILPTGWRGTIETVTLTGKRIKELSETGFDQYGTGNPFPYVLVTKGGNELDDDTVYEIPICGATDALREEGVASDSKILGLDAARTYFSRFETLSAEDISWK